ncbi:hypothetical protein PHLH4_15560 [Pseudomonas sp. St316]|nr:hypothetical protein PHLH4_15560 [Pseudomonas sp. St316]
MNMIQEKFASLFSNYEVTTQPRPDGGILLTLRNSDGKLFKRTISYAQLHAGISCPGRSARSVVTWLNRLASCHRSLCCRASIGLRCRLTIALESAGKTA